MPEAPSKQTGLPGRVLPLSVLALAGLLLAVVGAIWLLLHLWQLSPGGPSQQVAPEPARIEPALETSPQTDHAAFVKAKQRQLSSIGWVDQAKGVAHIPLQDALTLAAQGRLPLPGRPGPSSASGLDEVPSKEPAP